MAVMTGHSITQDGVQAACAGPYGSLAEAAGMADLLERGGWDVMRHEPSVELGGQQLVASVFDAAGAPVGTITCRTPTDATLDVGDEQFAEVVAPVLLLPMPEGGLSGPRAP